MPTRVRREPPSNTWRGKPHIIKDWAGNLPYGAKTFESLEEADSFLVEDQRARHPNATEDEFDTLLGEFYIDPVEE